MKKHLKILKNLSFYCENISGKYLLNTSQGFTNSTTSSFALHCIYIKSKNKKQQNNFNSDVINETLQHNSAHNYQCDLKKNTQSQY